MSTSIAWNFAGEKGTQQLTLRERGLKAHTGCRARQTQKVCRFGLRCSVDQQCETQLIEKGLHLSNAEIFDYAVFELVECRAGDVCGVCELGLRKAEVEPRAPDFVAYFL